MNNHKSEKKIMWYSLAFMAFSTVWGFGNVINGFSEYGGLKAIVSWALIFAIYFVPYALMVGEMGSAFKEAGGGVSSWILETIGPRMAYLAGWTYWIVHMPYISQKPNGAVIATSWAIFRDARISQMDVKLMAVICLALFLFAVWVASKGIGVLNKLTSLAGSTMFIMSILFIIMMIAAPAITGADVMDIEWSVETFMPTFDSKFFLNLSILVFAVGGCEKISPYVNKVKNSATGFPKGMIALAIMVMVCAILGTIAMGMMFDPAIINESKESFDSYVSNGSYWAFQKLGEYYHVGNLFLIIYAACNAVGQFSTLVLSIDAPLRMLLDNEDAEQFIPSKLLKKNKYGAYSNGIRMVAVLSGSIILIQSVVPGAASVLAQLNKLNSVTMPLRYLWVFAAYIALRKAAERFHPEYRFVKNQGLALTAGIWCFFVTAACCIMGMYVKGDMFSTALNVITPFVLTALGLILPVIKKREKTTA